MSTFHATLCSIGDCTCAHATCSKEQRGCCAFVSSHIISITCQSCLTSKAEAGRVKSEMNQTKPSETKASGSKNDKTKFIFCMALGVLSIVCLFMNMKCTRCCMYVLLNCDLCHLCGGRGTFEDDAYLGIMANATCTISNIGTLHVRDTIWPSNVIRYTVYKACIDFLWH